MQKPRIIFRETSSYHKLVFLFAALFITSVRLALYISNQTIASRSFLPILAFGALLAVNAWLAPLGEFMYIAFYLVFSFTPYSDSYFMPILGIYLICVVWAVRHWSIAALLLLVSNETLLILQSDNAYGQIVPSFMSVILVCCISIMARILNDRAKASEENLRVAQEEIAQAGRAVRSELAAQLHDTVAKDLARVAITAEGIALRHPELAGEMKPLSTLAYQASKRIRPMILDLDVTGTAPSLREAIETSATMLKAKSLTLNSVLEGEPGTVLGRQATLTAALFVRETATNALKYATPGSEVNLLVTINPQAVTLVMRNAIAPDGGNTGITGGFGLPNLETRVRDEGGEITFGRKGNDWVVFASIPNHKEETDG